jgi:hypothetical protein
MSRGRTVSVRVAAGEVAADDEGEEHAEHGEEGEDHGRILMPGARGHSSMNT